MYYPFEIATSASGKVLSSRRKLIFIVIIKYEDEATNSKQNL